MRSEGIVIGGIRSRAGPYGDEGIESFVIRVEFVPGGFCCSVPPPFSLGELGDRTNRRTFPDKPLLF